MLEFLKRLAGKRAAPEKAGEPPGAAEKGTGIPPVADGSRMAAYLKALAGTHPEVPHAPGAAMDSADGGEGLSAGKIIAATDASAPDQLAAWFIRQGFIGHQLCALLSQHWLINKACSRPAEDALRHGYKVVPADGEKLGDGALGIIERAGKAHKARQRLFQFIRTGRVFGLAIAVFRVRHPDPKYYEYPFNPDAVAPGSYEGISVVEPYWCMPQADGEAMRDPAAIGFYEPQWWMIGGRRYHRSHLCVYVGDEVPDILKPSYLYGGIPIPQKILERVYNAERTANEAPLLAMSKRTSVFKTNTAEARANMGDFMARLMNWLAFRDNHAIKIADIDNEDFQQFDTTLTDFDNVMMGQYQLVAAASDVPATKLLGTAPKGFNATGEHEAKSYHETLESIQEIYATPFLEKHLQLVALSEVKPETGACPCLSVAWEPADAPTSREREEIRKMRAETDVMLADAGVVDAAEIRQKMLNDEDSGYSGLGTDASADLNAELWALREEAGLPAIPPLPDGGASGSGYPGEESPGVAVGAPGAIPGAIPEAVSAMRRAAGMPPEGGPETGAAAAGMAEGLSALRHAAGMDAGEKKEFITINGAAVPVGEDGELLGKVGEKIKGAGEKKPLHHAPKTVEFSGKELGDMSRPMNEVARDARDIAIKKFAGKSFEATDGEEIEVTKKGIKHGLGQDANPSKAIVTTKLGEIIENAEFSKSEKDKKGRKDIKAVHQYRTKANIDGKNVSVVLFVREHTDGKRYYDHTVLQGTAGGV